MDKLTIIIKKYIKGAASEKEVIVIEKRMATDAQFAAEVAFQKNVLKSLQYVQQQDLKSFFLDLKPQLLQQLEEDTSKIFGNQVHYSLEQLKQWFSPLPLYEKRIASALRAAAITILLQPKPETNCENRQLTFEWERPKEGFEELDLILENNRREVLLEETIDPDSITYTTLLPQDVFPPGRYYWKFCVDEDEPLMGVFFVEKNLMREDKV
ncbi:MAG: hypothetical protein ACPG49_12835 [Chitinophagales bacterium]